jgi:ABC-type transporter Mla subunit MlaD
VIRRLATLAVVALAVAGALVMAGAGDDGERYAFAAEFDSADFLVSGQQVKIAGAVVGEVTAVRLSERRTAIVEMAVRPDFGPFRSDASCEIRPESLIGEKFVDCSPGTPDGEPLRARDGGPPTVPLEHTSSPVDLDIVFSALRLPYRQRLTLLVSELGTGLAGRPKELNAAIRRANPALQRANEVLAILNRDRRALGTLIDDSDRVIAELASRPREVEGFIARSEQVMRAVADRRGDLGRAIDGLPPLLAELEPAANDLSALAADARPVARELRSAAGPVERLFGELDPLTEAARPTLVKLTELSRTGRSAVRAATPVADRLLPVAQRLPETASLARELLDSLQANGVVEGLLEFVRLGSAATARFDRFSHIAPSYQIGGTCNVHATELDPVCDAHFGGGAAEGSEARARSRRRSRDTRDGDEPGRRRGSRPSPGPSAPGGSRPPQPPLPQAPSAPAPPGLPAPPQPPDPVQDVLDYLLSP